MTAPGLAHRIDRISIVIGQAAAWLTLAMVIATFIIVVTRYVFDSGAVWLQEAVTWMHAAVFMLGAAYTLQRDEHVRVDVFYREMSARRKAIVDLSGVILFLAPLCVFFLVESFDYVSQSWQIREVSRNSAGLPYPFIPLLKSTLMLLPLTLFLQGTAVVMRAIATLRQN